MGTGVGSGMGKLWRGICGGSRAQRTPLGPYGEKEKRRKQKGGMTEEERVRTVFKPEEARLGCGPAPETLLDSFTDCKNNNTTVQVNDYSLICGQDGSTKSSRLRLSTSFWYQTCKVVLQVTQTCMQLAAAVNPQRLPSVRRECLHSDPHTSTGKRDICTGTVTEVTGHKQWAFTLHICWMPLPSRAHHLSKILTLAVRPVKREESSLDKSQDDARDDERSRRPSSSSLYSKLS